MLKLLDKREAMLWILGAVLGCPRKADFPTKWTC
jgi:hypothetical protein